MKVLAFVYAVLLTLALTPPQPWLYPVLLLAALAAVGDLWLRALTAEPVLPAARIGLAAMAGLVTVPLVSIALHVSGIRIEARPLAAGLAVVATVLTFVALWRAGSFAPFNRAVLNRVVMRGHTAAKTDDAVAVGGPGVLRQSRGAAGRRGPSSESTGARPSPATDTPLPADSGSANPGAAAEPVAPANLGVAAEPVAPANLGVAAEPVAPANLGVAAESIAPANLGVAAESIAPANLGAESVVSANLGVAAESVVSAGPRVATEPVAAAGIGAVAASGVVGRTGAVSGSGMVGEWAESTDSTVLASAARAGLAGLSFDARLFRTLGVLAVPAVIVGGVGVVAVQAYERLPHPAQPGYTSVALGGWAAAIDGPVVIPAAGISVPVEITSGGLAAAVDELTVTVNDRAVGPAQPVRVVGGVTSVVPVHVPAPRDACLHRVQISLGSASAVFYAHATPAAPRC